MKTMKTNLTARDFDSAPIRAGLVVVVVMLAVEGLAVGTHSS